MAHIPESIRPLVGKKSANNGRPSLMDSGKNTSKRNNYTLSPGLQFFPR